MTTRGLETSQLVLTTRCLHVIGALLAALAGGLLTGYLLPEPGIPTENPPGVAEALWAIPGSVGLLAASWVYGARLERDNEDAVPTP